MTDLTCPFLGLRDDPDTCKLFPSEHNCCQRAQPVEPVALTHQAAFCLSAQHFRCPVFASKTAGPLPAPISATPRRVGNWRWVAVSLAAFTLALVLGLAGWQSGLPALPVPPETWTPPPTPQPASATPAPPTALPTDTPPPPPAPTLETAPTETPLPEATAAPAPTATTVVCVPRADWVLYIVQAGDTLTGLSQYFGVSLTALQQANCLPDNARLFTGQRLSVPNLPTPTAPTAADTATAAPTETATTTPTPLPAPTELPPTPTGTPKPLPTDTTQPTATPIPPTETRDVPPPNP